MNLRRFHRGVTLVAAGAILIVGLIAPALAQPKDEPDDGCGASNIVFDAACEVKDEVGDIVTAPIRSAAGSAVDMLTSWVSDSAQWLLGKVMNFIDDSTSPDLSAAWFTERYRFMIGLAALVLLPMLLIASIGAIMRQDVAGLLRSFFLYLPAAILGTFVAVFLTKTLLAATDALSAAVASGIGGDVSDTFDSVGRTLGPAGPAAPSFAIFFGALILIIGSFFVWLELLIRSAAVTVSVFFLPLILAGLVWPATSRWTRRLIETLIALILSKFVIVSVISLATAALADPGSGGFGAVMGAAALMLMAAFSPVVLLKLLPMAEGAAVAHLEGMSRRPVEAVRSGGSVNQAVSIMQSKIANAGSSPQVVAASSRSASGSMGTASTAGGGAAAGLAVAGAAKAAAGKAAKEPGRRLGEDIEASRPKAKSDSPPSKNVGGRLAGGSPIKPSSPKTTRPEADKDR
jgi:type IV secretion system protein TrbL